MDSEFASYLPHQGILSWVSSLSKTACCNFILSANVVNHRTKDETSCGIFRAPDYTEMDYETNKLKTNTDNIGKFD